MAIALDGVGVATGGAKRHRLWRRVGHALTYLGLAVALAFFLGPFFWIVTTSLKGNEDFFAFPPVWIPAEPSLKHYVALFTRSSGARYFTNSMVLSTLSMISALVVSLPTAYSIARWRFGGGFRSIFLLVLRLLPAIALIMPIYIVYKLLGITNNYLSLIVRSEEHTSELQSRSDLVCRLLLEKKKSTRITVTGRTDRHASSALRHDARHT